MFKKGEKSRRTVSVVIPAFNEEENIGGLVERIKKLKEVDEVVVVDDGSQDKTAEAAEKAGARVIKHPYNVGNGASVKTGGFKAEGDILVFMDADGQHPPEAISEMLKFIGEYDMVVASRTLESDVSRFRTFGNWLLKRVAEFLSEQKIPDLTSGFRTIKRERFEEFAHLFPQKYSYPTTLTLAMLSSGYFVKFLPVKGIKRREAGRSGISPFRDGLRFFQIILRIIMLYNPQKIFLPVGMFFLVAGTALGLYGVFSHGKLQESAVLLVIVGVFSLLFGLIAEQIAHLRREIS